MQKAVQSSQFSQLDISAEFTSAHRLQREDKFDHVVKESSISDKYFKVYYAHNDVRNSRLGIIASKRTLPSAVERNKAKRMIREAFRRHKIKEKHFDLVVMVRMGYGQNQTSKTDELNSLFGRIEDICAPF